MLAPATLALAISNCAVSPPTNLSPTQFAVLRSVQVADVEVESGGKAWAIGDDNAKPGQQHSYFPSSYGEAVALAHRLIQHDEAIRGYGVDVGVGQVNSHNFAKYGLTVETALRACTNLHVASEMLTDTFTDEIAALKNVPEPTRSWFATDRTLRIYNSGSANGPINYVVLVEAALQDHYVRDTLADLGQPALLRITAMGKPVVVPPPSSLVFGSDLDGLNGAAARNGVLPITPPGGAESSAAPPSQ